MINLKNILAVAATVFALATTSFVSSQPVPPGFPGAPGAPGRAGAAAPGGPGGPGGSPFRIERDIEYAHVGNRSLHLDLYLRDTSDKKPLPIILWVHGGGWVGGDKSPTPAARLIANGYAVASVEYRLAGEATFPAQLYDVKAAVRWLRANASKYNLDGAHIGAWGNSAGGHLVALLGTTGDIKELEGDEGNLDQSSRVQAVADFYGPIDLMRMDGTATKPKSDDPKLPEAIMLGGVMSKNTDKAKTANPITYISKDDPPFLIVHGTADQTVPPVQSEFFQIALKHAGVENTLEYVPGAEHNIKQVQTPSIAEAVNNFFDKHLRDNQHLTAGIGRIPVPPDSWIDPFSDDLPDTQYKLFATPSRGSIDGKIPQASYRIYFPPGYDLLKNAKRRYPVIYYLHGFNNDSRSAVLSGYIPRLDAAIRMGYMPPVIVVAAQILNDGKMIAPVQSVIVEDLIPHIDKTYRTVATRAGRAIEGHSFGGDYSLRIGFEHIDLFTSIAGLSPALGVPVNASQEIITPGTPPVTELPSRVDAVWSWLDTNADKIRGRTYIRLIIGTNDTLIYRSKLMSETLTRLKIEHSFTEAAGSPHDIREVLARVDDNPFVYYGKVFAKFK